MIVSDRTRDILAIRRERRDRKRAGWIEVEVDWRLHRALGWQDRRLEAVEIAADGKHVWYRIAPAEPRREVAA